MSREPRRWKLELQLQRTASESILHTVSKMSCQLDQFCRLDITKAYNSTKILGSHTLSNVTATKFGRFDIINIFDSAHLIRSPNDCKNFNL